MFFRRRKATFWSLLLLGLILSVSAMTDKIKQSDTVIRNIATTHQVVALTIDDGPHYKTTPEVLAVLREKGVRATLFVLGANVKEHPELLRQAVADGHEIGTHAYSHTLLTKLPPEAIASELDKATELVSQDAVSPVLFRPPGGAVNKTVLDAARARGYTTVTWSIDPEDWKCPPVDTVVNHVMENIKPGSIILLHDGQYPLPTPEALRILIDRLRLQGYQFVTVSELLQYEEVSP